MPATTPILFPSGEDANPLNRRLPAEVVTRRRREAKKVEEKPVDEVRVDLKTALSLKPEGRCKWLGKACKMAEEGRASTTDLYSIVSSRKFTAGINPKIGRRMMDIVRENLGIFSDKQQRHLKSEEWVMGATFGERVGPDADVDEQDADVALRDRRADSSERSGDERQARTRTFEERPEESRQQREAQDKREARREARRSEPEGWTEAAAARGQGERARREALLAEERARRKAREREEQDAMMAGHPSWATRTVGANNKERWLAVEAENAKRREEEQQQAKKKQLEEEADSSLLALERIGTQKAPEPEKPKEKKKGGLSRSRSIVSRSRSRGRGSGRRRNREGSYSVSVQRSRSRGRRRRRQGSGGVRDKAAFDEALRRRMEEREAHDTTRIPVVDPGHAARMLGGSR
mmetsp:Transcript_48014/g.139054  ORF Transcript_48014/g.139054 Transcript_48014/m.139054 type:complete len:408 (-) Transcript_48014:99-1322(-)